MERNGRLIRRKYSEYFLATLAMSGSASVASIVDRILVGNLLSANDLNATNLIAPLIYVLNMVFGLFIYGGNTLAVTYKGKRDQRSADKCFTISILVGTFVMALLTGIGLIFRDPLANALCVGHRELYQPVSDYLFPTLFLGMLVIPLNGTAAFVRVDGLRKLAVALPIVSNVINLTLDYVFMGVLKTGIAGAGWATNIGFAATLVLLIPYFRSPKRSVFFARIGWKDLRLMLNAFHLGLATALMYLCMFIKNQFLNVIILSTLGTVGGQITAVCSAIMSVGNIFFTGTAQTMLPINGALYGAQDYRGIRELFKTALTVMESICIVITAVFMIFPLQTAAVFGVRSVEAQALLPLAIFMFSLCIPVTGFLFILRSHYQSTGHRNAATVLTVLEGTLYFIPALWFLSKINANFVWLSHVISISLAIVTMLMAMGIKVKKDGRSAILLLPAHTDGNAVDFSIDNKVDCAVDAAHQAAAFCETHGVPGEIAHRIGVSVEELCVNTAKYAADPRSDTVDVFIKITDASVILTVRDNGKVFNPTEYIDDSGREITGLKMLRDISSKVEYNRVIGFNTTIVTVDRTA